VHSGKRVAVCGSESGSAYLRSGNEVAIGRVEI
jgi:hypothetical protein